MLGVIVGCSGNKQNKTVEELILDELNKKYNTSLNFFGKAMVDHFPKKIKNEKSSFTDSFSPELGNLELVLLDSVETDNLPEIVKEYNDKAVTKYYASDTCLLIVNRFVSQNNHYKVVPSGKDLKLIDLECYKGKLPIPNFWHNDYTTDDTECKLPKDFSLYVLETKAGKFVVDSLLTDGRFMPERWKNGYSKGVAISEKRRVIIYWLVIW